MSTVVTDPDPVRPPRRRISRTGLAVGILVGAMLALAVVTSRPSSEAPAGAGATGTQAFEAYLAELEPVVRAGGATVVLGLRNGVADVGQSRYDDDVLHNMVAGWQAELTGLGEDLAAITPPDELREGHRLLVQAMDGYVGVADLLADALELAGDARLELAKDAAAAGTHADDTWDRGARLIQAHARALGTNPISWLPDDDGRPS